jgi:hypothetical protein
VQAKQEQPNNDQNPNEQTQNIKLRSSGFGSLDIGDLNLFGDWNLVIGI